MVQPEHEELSVRRQCELLRLSRAGLYYEPVEVSADELALMRRIDELYLKRPYFGSRRMTTELRGEGREVNRKRVQRLMGLMGLESVVPGPHTSRRHPAHPVFPYLLRGLSVERPNQVWATDITYIPLAYGWAYLVVIMDWFSRAVLSWRLSNSLSTEFCVAAVTEAFEQYGAPEIFNSDQGAQFTDAAFIATLQSRGVRISMDGKGRCLDNVFVERLWWSLKYEDVYLHDYTDVREAFTGIDKWLGFYNFERGHQSLADQTPMTVYRTGVIERVA